VWNCLINDEEYACKLSRLSAFKLSGATVIDSLIWQILPIVGRGFGPAAHVDELQHLANL
jgi:hypothetical protein